MSWTIVNTSIAEYRDLYETAVKYNQSEFILNGHKVLTKFAKYHLEYLNNELEKEINNGNTKRSG